MSYTKTYHGQVAWYTRGSVSYPPSEHGGTASYSASGTVPVTINVIVDTTPFDTSIINLKHSEKGLSGAVVALNAAQCGSIAQSSHKIADTVTKDFFNMIKSTISQDMAALLNKINSAIGLVVEKTAMLRKQQDVMQRDYARTLAHYKKVFYDIDAECKRRVVQLDKEAYELSNVALKEQLGQRQTKDVVDTLTSLSEGIHTDTILKAAHLKRHSLEAIHTLGDCVIGQNNFTHKLANILASDTKVAGSTDGVAYASAATSAAMEEYLPVLYMESDDLEAGHGVSKTSYVAEGSLGQNEKAICAAVSSYCEGKTAISADSADIEQRVREGFISLCQGYMDRGGNSRIYDTMLKLLGQSKGE